jgi:hypothetical protein
VEKRERSFLKKGRVGKNKTTKITCDERKNFFWGSPGGFGKIVYMGVFFLLIFIIVNY